MNGSLTLEAWLTVAVITMVMAYAILRMVVTTYCNQVGRHDLRVDIARLRADRAAALRAARDAAEAARQPKKVQPLVPGKTNDDETADAVEVEVAEAVEMAEAA